MRSPPTTSIEFFWGEHNRRVPDDPRRSASARSRCTRRRAPVFVVNVSSAAVFNASGSSIAYVASKAALNTMTLSLARLLAPLIRVNAVCPGYMDTPWWTRDVGQERADKLRDIVKAAVPLRVASRPEDTAEVVTFLASPASRHMTGSLVPVNAGFLLSAAITPSQARQ